MTPQEQTMSGQQHGQCLKEQQLLQRLGSIERCLGRDGNVFVTEVHEYKKQHVLYVGLILVLLLATFFTDEIVIEWDHPLIIVDVPMQANAPPYPQANTYSTYAAGIIFGSSDISQQFRFVFYNQSGQVVFKNWSLLTTKFLREDAIDSNIPVSQFYNSYLENDIDVLFQNTAGAVYMVPFKLTQPIATMPSLTLQAYCASFITGPQSGAAAMIQPQSTAQKPANYTANVGITVAMTQVTQIQNSAIDYKIKFTNVFFASYPRATWKFQIYKKSSTVTQTLINSGDVILNQDTPLLLSYLYKFINNFQYILKLQCFDRGVEVVGPFPEIQLTGYMGLALNASRTSGVLGNSPDIYSIPSMYGNAALNLTAMYLSPYQTIPTNDIDLLQYVELKLVVNLQSRVYQYQDSLTVWYNFESENGYWPLCLNQFISDQAEIFLKTGGQNQFNTQFNPQYLKTLVSAQTPLYFNMSVFELNKGAFNSEEFTSAKLTNSLEPLVNLAVQQPNQWVTNVNYIVSPQKTRMAQTSTLSFQIFAKYTPNTPIDDPFGTIEAIKESAVDQGQDIMEHIGRNLDSIMYPDKRINNKFKAQYLNDAEPTPQQKALEFTYNNPAQIESMEKAKEQAHQLIKTEAKGWEVSPVEDFYGMVNSLDSAAARIKYPDLMKRDKDNQLSNVKMFQEFYPKAVEVNELFQAPNNFKRAPAYKGMNQNEKYVTQETIGSFSNMLKSAIIANPIRDQQMIIETNIAEKRANGQVDYSPVTEQTLFYYGLGLNYNPWNETQQLMRESLMNPENTDLYVPGNQILGGVPTYSMMAEDWAARQFNLQTFAVIAANYALEKRKYNAEVIKGLDKGSAQDAISGILKEAVYNVNPLTVEATLWGKATAKGLAQKQLADMIYDYAKQYVSFDQLVSLFSSMKKIPKYQETLNRNMPFPPHYLTMKSTIDAYTTDEIRKFNRLKAEREQITKYPLRVRRYIFDPLNNRKFITVPEAIYIGDWEKDHPNYTKQDLDIFKHKYLKFKYPQYEQMLQNFPMANLADKLLGDTGIKDNVQDTVQSVIDKLKAAVEAGKPVYNAGKYITELSLWLLHNQLKYQTKGAKNFLYYAMYPYLWGMHGASYVALPLMDLVGNAAAWPVRKILEHTPAEQIASKSWNVTKDLAYRGYNKVVDNISMQDLIRRNAKEYAREQEFRNQILKASNPYQPPPRRLYESKPANDTQPFNQTIENTIKNNSFTEEVMKAIPEPIKKQAEKITKEFVKKQAEKVIPKKIQTVYNQFTQSSILDNFKQKVDKIIPENVKKRVKKAQEKVNENYSSDPLLKYILYGAGAAGAVYGAKKLYDKYTTPQNVSSIPSNNSSEIPANVSTFGNFSSEPVKAVEPEIVIDTTEFFKDQQQQVIEQKAREAIQAQAVLAHTIQQTSDNPIELNAILDDDKTVDVNDRYENVHALSKVIESLDRKVKDSLKIQHYLKIGFGNMFERQYKRQYTKGNMQGFYHFKMLKAITNPETPDEYQLQAAFYKYFLDRPIYDSHNVLGKKYGEPLMTGLKEIMQSPGPVFDFIERISKKEGAHKTSFNGSMYTETPRPVYNVPEPKRIRPLIDDMNFMTLKRLKKKVLGKRIREEEKKVVRQTMNSLMNQMSNVKASPYQMMKMSEHLAGRAHGQIDLGYVKTLLYPELYNADIPQPLSTQSYTRFTDKKEIALRSSLSVAASGAILVWYPKTVIGPSMFIRYGNLDQPLTFALPDAATDTSWKAIGGYDYSDYFSQANLVSAALSIQYIGQLQLEQGYMVGSQIYGISPGAITVDDIENGQFRVMAKPGDGMRTVYLPKDTSDFQYYPIAKSSVGTETAGVRAKNNGNRPEGETRTLKATALAVAGNWVGPQQNPSLDTITVAQQVVTITKQNINLSYNTDGDCVVFYWKGLALSANEDLRIDVIRRFNGFPIAKYRDILDLTKPKKLFDPKKTIDVIQELQTAIPQLCGHSLKQMDRVSDQIQEFIPNIGHLYDEGMLKEGTSLEGFATQLQQIAGNEGAAVSVPGRIYDD